MELSSAVVLFSPASLTLSVLREERRQGGGGENWQRKLELSLQGELASLHPQCDSAQRVAQ